MKTLIQAFNVNRRALTEGKRTVDQARQENVALGRGWDKVLGVVKTKVSASIAAGEKVDTSFFADKETEKKQ